MMWKYVNILIAIVTLTLISFGYISLHPINSYQIQIKGVKLSIKNIRDKVYNLINMGFSSPDFQQAKLEEIEREQLYNITAVLLHWQRLGGIQKTAEYLLDTGFFKQIIIWNNNPHINLTLNHVIEHHPMKKFIRIINSEVNLKDEAKYRGCVEAKTRACFYVDDDWDVSHYLKSLIASFRSDPYLLHAVTDSTYYTNLVWSYFDKDIDLHSGFSWIGCGSVFLRQHAEKHLQLVHKYLKNQTELIPFSDVFFSIWLNDIPVQLTTIIRSQPSKSLQKEVSFSSTPQFAHLQYTSSITAIRILEHLLRFDLSNSPDSITFSRHENRRFPYYIKSPSFNDDLIFYSNILPYELQNVSFNISRDFARGTRRNLPRNHNLKHFQLYSPWNALDSNLSTCWYPNRQIRLNDFFAIDFLFIQTSVVFTVAVRHSQLLQKQLDLRISFDGLEWLSYRSSNGIYVQINRTLEQHLHTYLYDASEFNEGYKSFRYISFKALEDFDSHFKVCEIEIISKKDIDNTKHYFHRLDV